MPSTRNTKRLSTGRIIKRPKCDSNCENPNEKSVSIPKTINKKTGKGKKRTQNRLPLKECVVNLTPMKIPENDENTVKKGVVNLEESSSNQLQSKTQSGRTKENRVLANANKKNTVKQCVVNLERLIPNQIKKKQRFVNSPLETSTPIRTTSDSEKSFTPIKPQRAKKNVKYAESPLEISQNNEEKPKVPVYKQHVKEKKQKNDDLYEFDSDSDENKQNKKRTKKSLNDTSLEKFLNKAIKKKKKVKKKLPAKLVEPPPQCNENDQNDNIIDNCSSDEEFLPEAKFPKPTHLRKIVLGPSNNELIPEKSTPKVTVLSNVLLTPVHKKIIPEKPTPKVTVLTNKSLTTSHELHLDFDSPVFEKGRPNAHSTLLRKPLAPWRYNNVCMTRNPHFISYKDSALPNINQEIVLDHTVVDKLNNTMNICKSNSKRSLHQATLSEYLDCNKENEESRNAANISLFDDDQFSPIKRNPALNVTGRVKRRILGEINDNSVSSTVNEVSALLSPVKGTGNEISFGFGTDDEVENVQVKSKTDKPFRLSMSVNDRKYQPKKKVQFQKEEVLPDSDDESRSDVSEEEIEDRQYGLFEDFDTTHPVEVKRKRKFDGENRQKSKKRKDVRTKEEEAEADEWAAAFNSMCAEVEEFPLEIE